MGCSVMVSAFQVMVNAELLCRLIYPHYTELVKRDGEGKEDFFVKNHVCSCGQDCTTEVCLS